MSSDDENIYYSAALKKNDLYGDQPERRQINYLMNGNFLYDTRYGYACKIQDLRPLLPSCITCKNSIQNSTINDMNTCG